MNGFLGTGATLAADVNLTIQILMGIALLAGMILARHRCYRAHGVCQGSVTLLNLVMIAFIMFSSFELGVVPELKVKFSESYYFIPTLHASLGTLDGNELREIEEHLKTRCGVCEEMLKENEKVLSLIPYSIPSATPFPRVKEKLFKKIRATKQIEEKTFAPTFRERLQPLWLRLGGAVALVLLIILFISNLSLRNRLTQQQLEISSLKEQVTNQYEIMNSLRIQLATKEANLNNLKEQIARQSTMMEFLQNPNVVTINLSGLKPDSRASGRVLWDRKNNNALFYGLNLPPIPSGKIYQLWVIADNTPISMGIFNVDERGNNIIQVANIPDPSKVQKFAVTLEPAGGVSQPTGEMYLISAS